MKSERLKKLEAELKDLQQWLQLGLVPKKEVEKHKKEIESVEAKIKEEKARLQFIKETGESEEYMAPKRTTGKQVYAEPQTLPGMDVIPEGETAALEAEEAFDMESAKETRGFKEEATVIEDLEEDPFSDKNRWKRGILEDPDADVW